MLIIMMQTLMYSLYPELPILPPADPIMLVSSWYLLQNKTCVQTLEGHAQNVSSVIFHPTLPVILSGSEDGIHY